VLPDVQLPLARVEFRLPVFLCYPPPLEGGCLQGKRIEMETLPISQEGTALL